MKLNIITIQLFVFIVLASTIYSFAQQKSLAEARLVVDSFSPKKDSVISIGVLISLKDDWHIYWRNPGDSGMPTDIEFNLPNGITAYEIKFPVPETFTADEIVNYGYSHQVLLMSELFIPSEYPQKEISITAKLTSLICKDLCKAFDTTITIKLDISKSYLAEANISDLFESTKNLLPQKNHSLKTSATFNSDSVYLKVNGDEIIDARSVRFLSYESGMFLNRVNQKAVIKGSHLELILEPDPFRVKKPTEVNGIIYLNDDHTKAYEINLPIAN